MEGSLVAYKVFTNGSVLNASEINDNLMNQSVMVFSNSTARAAALTAPVEGMLTWLQDVNRYENYNGSAWVELGQASGLVKLNTTTFSVVASQSIDNVFSSTYDNYQILLNGTGSTNAAILYNLRVSTTDTTTNYQRQSLSANGGTVSGGRASDTEIGVIDTAALVNSFELTLFNPNKAAKTTGFTTSIRDLAGSGMQLTNYAVVQNASTQFDGIKLFPSSGTFSGTITIYGMAK